MTSLQVTLEIVTPLFLAGADPRGTPELRAASVRGALRFWLRALLGGVIGDAPDRLDDLRKAESAVFGSTDMGASPVVVRIQHSSLTQVPYSHLAAWNSTKHSYDKAGIAYLFFVARKAGSEPERNAIAANTEFDLTLTTRGSVGTAREHAGRMAYAALWLLTHLGGVGARSRRGGGNLQVMKVTNIVSNMPSLTINATTPAALQAEMKSGLNSLRRLTNDVANVNNPSDFDVLHPDVCKVWVMDKSFNTWVDALETVGRAMQVFRTRRNPDYQNVKNAMQGQPLRQPVQRAAFGLPIVFFYSSLYRQYQNQGDSQSAARRKATGTLGGEHHDRRSSPLLIRVTKLANGRFAIVLTLFYAHLLPDGESLKIEAQGLSQLTGMPNLGLLNDFLSDLDRKVAPRLEVTGW